MVEEKKGASVEEALMDELRFGGLDKENLKELVTIAASIQRAGLRRYKAFPKGTPLPDGIRVTGVVDAAEVSAFLGKILPGTPRLGGVVVFPYGTPRPDLFGVNVDLGASPQAAGLG